MPPGHSSCTTRWTLQALNEGERAHTLTKVLAVIKTRKTRLRLANQFGMKATNKQHIHVNIIHVPEKKSLFIMPDLYFCDVMFCQAFVCI